MRRVLLKREDLRWPIPTDACRALESRTCTDTFRRSKYLGLQFDGPGRPVALIHLGMSGRLWVDQFTEDPAWRDHEHWRMDFGGYLLRYVDARRFGMLDVVGAEDLHDHRLLRELGPEPLSEEFDGEYLFHRSRRRKVSTKAFLMDAKNVVGIGNIYASESCYRAGVRPGKAVHRLTRVQCTALAAAAKDILELALRAGGTTIRDYVGVEENTGYFQRELMVYDRAGEPCRTCGTEIKRTVHTGRSTFYCPSCQA